MAQTTIDAETQASADAAEIVSRRGLLASPWKAVLAAAAGATLLNACDLTTAPFSRDVHLLRRLTYGATPAALADLETKGEAAWLAEQLDPSTLDTTVLDAKIAQLPALSIENPWELLQAYPNNQASTLARAQLMLASLIRQVHSPAQLQERMVEFWADHFNVPADGRYLSLMKIYDDRVVSREHTLGRFKDLLVASAKSPAMLDYLDNWTSSAGAINENYGRELLELHTLGVGAGYDEDDVVDTARLLTGWTMFRGLGVYVFNEAKHDSGAVDIMGWTRPAGTDYEAHGEEFLHWLAMRPETANFVCTKIARRFVADFPDQSLVDAMAAAWLANDSQIVPVLEAMIAHTGFEANPKQKFCRPLDYLVKTIRSIDADVAATLELNQLTQMGNVLGSLGQLPFFWPAPNGYPDVEGAWLNTGALLNRWNLVGDLLASQFPFITIDPAPFLATLQGKQASEIFDVVADTFLLESTTTDGQTLLSTNSGWSAGYVPTTGEIAASIANVALAILASTDSMYR